MKILVVGDVMLDVYFWGSAIRLSPEAPVPILKIERMETRWGGAANVALNAAAMGAEVTLVGVGVSDIPPETIHYVPIAGAFTKKTRGMAGGHQIFRYDSDVLATAKQAIAVRDAALDYIPSSDIVVFSDYAKGALDHIHVLLTACAKHGKTSIVDPKVADWYRYNGASFITPNQSEFMTAFGIHQDTTVIETRGAEGAVIHGKTGVVRAEGFHVPCLDPTGAGDSFVAMLAVGLASGKHPLEAVKMANAAGAAAVQHLGTHVVTQQEAYDVYAGRV